VVFSSYATAGTSNLALDSGDGVSYIVPIYKENVLSHIILRLDLTRRNSDCNITSNVEHEVVKNFKE
ncbi:actin, partial [Schistosoma japonicum]